MLLPYLERDAGAARTFFARADAHLLRRRRRCRRACGSGWRRCSRQGTGGDGADDFVLGHDRDGADGDDGALSRSTGRESSASRRPASRSSSAPSGDKLEMPRARSERHAGLLEAAGAHAQGVRRRGVLRTGDAASFVDPRAPAKGIVFDGRIAENFKLSTGTWVHVGALRVAALAAARRWSQDAVVAGHDRDEVGLLAFAESRRLPRPMPRSCRRLRRRRRSLAHPAVREAIVRGLRAPQRREPAAPQCASRACMLLPEPPSIDANEITDKGYINQRAVLQRRAGAGRAALRGARPCRGDRDSTTHRLTVTAARPRSTRWRRRAPLRPRRRRP